MLFRSGVLLIDSHGILLEPPPQAQFTFPVLSGVREDETEAQRRERVRVLLRVQDELGYLAKDVSEVNATDPDNVRIVAQVDNHALELILGDSNFARTLPEFPQPLSGDSQALSGGSKRSTCGWTTALPRRNRAHGSETDLRSWTRRGSRRTRLAICLLEEGRLRFLGCGSVESQGWIKGRIADQGAVAASILAALREAEANAQVSVESVVVGMGGPTVRGANGRGVIELGHVREIEQRDVNRVVDRASHVQLQEDRMVLQLFPQDFVVDDHPGHRDPRRMLASRLEINVHLVISLGAGAQLADRRREPGAPPRGRDGVRGVWPPAMPRCCPKSAAKASRWSISARIPPSWWSTTAMPCTWLPPSGSAATISRATWRRACASASRTPS